MKRLIITLLLLTGIVVLWLLLTSQTKSGWTIETLKEYYDERFDALQLAITKAEASSAEKFANTNEWRNSYDDLTRTYMPRAESEAKFTALSARVDVLSESVKKIENVKQGGNIVWAYLISAVSLIAAIVSISINVQKKRT